MRDFDDIPLLTTVVGSYPNGGLPPRRAIQRAVVDQIVAGVEIVSDGQVRGDMLAIFARHIPGLRLAHDGVWEVTTALDLPAEPITAADYAFAREIAGDRAEVKGIVTGPITLALSCRVLPTAPYAGPDDPALVLRLAEVMAREVAALVAAGAHIVQVDEPLLAPALGTRIAPELAYDALRDLAMLPALPMLHVCGDIRAQVAELLLLPFAALSIENTRIANLAAIDADQLQAAGMTLAVGCVESQADEAETEATIAERVRAAAALVPPARLWIAPDCGLRLLPAASALAKLTRMVAAVQTVRAEL